MAAGAASKKGLIGYIVPFGIPEVVRHINAFALGAQATIRRPGSSCSGRTRGSRLRRRRRPRRTSSPQVWTCSVRTWTVRQQASSPRRRHPVGRVRLGRAEDGAEAVADGGDVQLGPVLREAGQGRDQRNLEAGVLLRHGQGRLHGARAVRPEGQREDEGGDAAKKKAIVSGKFNVFTGPLYDQKGKVMVPAGKTLKVFRTSTRCSGSPRV